MVTLLAAAPLLLVLFAMGILRWSAVLAGSVGLLAAIALAATQFDITQAGAIGGGTAAAGVGFEALHATLAILWIILPALTLYEYQKLSGGIDRIRDALSRMTDDRRLQALLIAWFFGLFMEGAAGFGTPVALAAPLLVGIGFPPVRAVALALIGHAAGVAFGAVGTPALTQVEITGLDPLALATATAMICAALGLGLALMVSRLADSGPLTLADTGRAGAAWASFALPFLAIAVFVGPELPSLAAGLTGLALFTLVLRRRATPADGPAPRLGADMLPYLLIVLAVLATRLAPDVKAALVGVELGWTFAGAFSGRFAPLFHPGTLVALSLVIAALATGRGALLAPAVGEALRKLAPVALALLVMLALSRIMVLSGMIGTLAESAAGTGAFWPLLAPMVGVIGTFVSGSATASNIIFTPFQASTADALGLSLVVMAAAQGAGAAIGNMIAPHNIIAGGATVGLTKKEGAILRLTAPVCLACLVLAGALVLAGVAFAPRGG